MTVSQICVRFISGDETHFDAPIPARELRVRIANMFERFALEVRTFCYTSGTEFKDDDEVYVPLIVVAELINVVYNEDMWKDAMILHASTGDTEGVRRAAASIDSREDYLIGKAILTEAFMQNLVISNDIAGREGLCSETFLEVGVDVYQENEHGATSLQLASEYGDLHTVDGLLAAGAQVNHANNFGWTILMCAAWNGHLKVIDRLLAAGALVDHTDDCVLTILDCATERGHPGVIDRLVAARAQQ